MKMDHEQQMAQAEEVLGDRMHEVGFAKGLFFGQYLSQQAAALSRSRSTILGPARWSPTCAASAASTSIRPRSIAMPRFRRA